MPARTLKQTFYENLKVYPEARVPNNYRSLGKEADEQVKCIIVIPDPLITLAHSYLSRITASPATALNSLALPIDDTINFQTEADVLRASCLELLYPVNKALTEGLGKGERVFCGGERKMNASRVDLRWSYQANENAESHVFAILEFKNTRTIHPREFRPANSEGDEIKRKLYTQMRHNATKITEQIMKYLDDSDAPFLAVFDWNTMGIFDFTEYRPQSRTPGNPTFTSMRETEFGPHVHETHRFLLLGFLVRALEWQRAR